MTCEQPDASADRFPFVATARLRSANWDPNPPEMACTRLIAYGQSISIVLSCFTLLHDVPKCFLETPWFCDMAMETNPWKNK